MKSNGIRKSRKRMNQLRGKLRQKVKNGPYYYRLMVANGIRREFAMKTCDFEEACRKAADMDAVWEAPDKEVAEQYAAYLKTCPLAVNTYNCKIKRLRRIFNCLKDYYAEDNPFRAKSLLRNEFEEQNTIVRRQAFTQEQEQHAASDRTIRNWMKEEKEY